MRIRSEPGFPISDSKVDLKVPAKSLGVDYEKGNVYAIEYNSGQIPDDKKWG